jgi:hypothetical protein
MSSISSELPGDNLENPQISPLRQLLRSRWTFVVLQVLDLLTTMYAFHVGAVEINPLVAHLTVMFGKFQGVLISKLIAVAIAMGVRRLIWIVNVLYGAIVIWNIAMIAGMLLGAKP